MNKAGKMNGKIKVAIIFRRFGPYHVARLEAAAKIFSVCAIEYASSDNTYAWDAVNGTYNFARKVITKHVPTSLNGKRMAQVGMAQVLNDYAPMACVLPGWALQESLMGLRWCVKRRVPAVVMSESTAWDEPRVTWKETVKRRVISLFSAGLVGGTPQAEYLAELGMPRDRIFLGYDVVDNAHFMARAEGGNLKPEMSAAAALQPSSSIPHPFFLASSRFIEKKNLPRLIQAYARYRELASPCPLGGEGRGEGERRHADSRISDLWNLVLLGDGPLKPDLCRLISDLGLQNSVLLPGFKQYDELPHYYARAGAFIHASTAEQWGLVVNEAMAAGLPVLVSNRCGCARDLVQEGVNGFTFDPYDTEQLARLMHRISSLGPLGGEGTGERAGAGFATPDHRVSEALAAMGRESLRIISNWGPERFAEGLNRAVNAALAQPPRRASWLDRLLLRLLIYR